MPRGDRVKSVELETLISKGANATKGYGAARAKKYDKNKKDRNWLSGATDGRRSREPSFSDVVVGGEVMSVADSVATARGPSAVDDDVSIEIVPVTTRLRVQNICCDLEKVLILKLLDPATYEGVIDVKVNTVGRVAIIKHYSNIDPEDLAEKLNKAKLGASIQSRTADAAVEEDMTETYLVMAHLAIVVALFAVAAIGSLTTDGDMAFNWVAITSIAIGIPPLLQKALMSLRYQIVGIDLLMTLAAIGAMITQVTRPTSSYLCCCCCCFCCFLLCIRCLCCGFFCPKAD